MAQEFPKGQIVCPIDGTLDTIQKVSAIVNGAVIGVRMDYMGYDGPSVATGDFRSRLGMLLAHDRPFYHPPLDSAGWLASIIFIILPGVFCAIVGLSNVFPLFIVAAILLGVFSLGVSNSYKNARATYAQAYPIWQWEHVIWEKLYYCSRHDLVFLPGTQWVDSPERMNDLLHDIGRSQPAMTYNPTINTSAGSPHMDSGSTLKYEQYDMHHDDFDDDDDDDFDDDWNETNGEYDENRDYGPSDSSEGW